jgi:hypothetical protein
VVYQGLKRLRLSSRVDPGLLDDAIVDPALARGTPRSERYWSFRMRLLFTRGRSPPEQPG